MNEEEEGRDQLQTDRTDSADHAYFGGPFGRVLLKRASSHRSSSSRVGSSVSVGTVPVGTRRGALGQ